MKKKKIVGILILTIIVIALTILGYLTSQKTEEQLIEQTFEPIPHSKQIEWSVIDELIGEVEDINVDVREDPYTKKNNVTVGFSIPEYMEKEQMKNKILENSFNVFERLFTSKHEVGVVGIIASFPIVARAR
ncbi:MAG: hypothetical protein NWF08_03970 [Candidatus Bathyarchaeota archaeon]|nr:hypothetical protein [Candidatus Bathyarchaeota archaeon]